MPYVITDYMHKREVVIARLQSEITNAIASAADRPEVLTAAEILIALNEAAQRWARELHKQDVAENDPAKRP